MSTTPARQPAGVPSGGQFAAQSNPESDVELDGSGVGEVWAERRAALRSEIRSMGMPGDRAEAPSGSFFVELNNGVIGDPYIEETGWYPDLETAQTAAALMIHQVNRIAIRQLADDPSSGYGWVHPEQEAESSWATVVSVEDADGERDGEPAFEEQYAGDEWLASSAEIDLLDEDQSRRVTRLREFQANADVRRQATA
jgi:hypothetical protein